MGCNTTVSEPEHPYTVTLPESWGNRAAVVHLDDGVDIAVDGLPILNFRLVENIPGARERADELIVDGYQWDYTIETANNKYFYFFKDINPLPENLSHPDVDDTPVLRQVIKYSKKDAVFELEGFEAKYTKPNYFGTFTYTDYLGVLKSNVYTNYITGISFSVPESIREKCWFTIADKTWFTILLKTGVYTAKYPLCQIFAFPPDSSLREIYCFPEYYPEVVHHEDGYLYGAINVWQPDILRGYYYQPYWDNIPLNYRNMITTEEVQQIVDSFTILSDTPDLGN